MNRINFIAKLINANNRTQLQRSYSANECKWTSTKIRDMRKKVLNNSRQEQSIKQRTNTTHYRRAPWCCQLSEKTTNE